MTEWRFVVKEINVFHVELDTNDEDEAYEKIREMAASGEINFARPDEYENEEFVEAI